MSTGGLLVTATPQRLTANVYSRERYRIQNMSPDTLIHWRVLPPTVTDPNPEELAVSHWL